VHVLCIAVEAGVVVGPSVTVWFDGETSTKVSTVHHATSGQLQSRFILTAQHFVITTIAFSLMTYIHTRGLSAANNL